jgi:hypothetical protein
MNAANRRRSPVQWQLEAYEESWKQDHQAAMACRDLEDTMAVGIAVFRLVEHVVESWKDRVFRGTQAYTEEDDLWVRDLFRCWLRVTEGVLGKVPGLEEHFGLVSGADELRGLASRAHAILQEWQPPKQAAAVGLRELTLSPEGAAELDRRIEEAKRSPPPMPTRRLPIQESSFLLKRSS